MITKTEQMKTFFKKAEYKKALKIAKGFNRVFDKDEMKTLGRAYEMHTNERFFKALGFDKDAEIKKAKEIIKTKYKL